MSSPKIEKIKRKIYDVVKYCNYFPWMPDSWYLKLLYRATEGKKLNLANPQTFNEKLQWLKLYDRRPEYVDMADKYKVRRVVADKIGEEYLPPLLGVWDNFDDIDFSKLPNKFVLKCNHDSHSVFICKDKNLFDPSTVRDKFVKALRKNFYLHGREWVYKDITPKIIAEAFLEEAGCLAPTDYKIMCANGVPKLIQVISGRGSAELKIDFYDSCWNKLKVRQSGYASSDELMKKPEFLDEALELSKKLSYGIPQVRVDWYFATINNQQSTINNQRLFFGELTFYDSCGFCAFEPEEFGDLLGSWITLPSRKNGKWF